MDNKMKHNNKKVNEWMNRYIINSLLLQAPFLN